MTQLIPPGFARMTRRSFGMSLFGAAAIGGSVARADTAAADPFAVCVLPDPQHMANPTWNSQNPALYGQMMQWIVDNRNTTIDGAPLNLKAIWSVGDCQDFVTYNAQHAQELVSIPALLKAPKANIPFMICAGNHEYDYLDGSPLTRDKIGWKMHTGPFSPSNVSSMFSGSNGMLIAGSRTDRVLYGGCFDEAAAGSGFPTSTANAYYKMYVGGLKWLIIVLEFYPRSLIMNWAKALMAQYPDHQAFVLTHGYSTDVPNNLIQRGATGNYATDKYGPDFYSMAAAPVANSGVEMWGGSDATWTGLKTTQLAGISCGHWLDPGDTANNPGGKYWWQNRRQRDDGGYMLETFANWQQRDQPFTSGSASAHVVFLRFDPAAGTVKLYAYSVNKGQWITSGDRTYGANATALASVPFTFQSPDAPTFSGSAAISGTLR